MQGGVQMQRRTYQQYAIYPQRILPLFLQVASSSMAAVPMEAQAEDAPESEDTADTNESEHHQDDDAHPAEVDAENAQAVLPPVDKKRARNADAAVPAAKSPKISATKARKALRDINSH